MDGRLFILLAVFGLTQSADLSCEEIRMFVDGHNSRRLRLANGEVPGQPAAAEMKYMIWDEELAYKAQRWASRHEFEHNPNNKVDSRRFTTGENLYRFGTTDENDQLDINNVLDEWFDEYVIYTYGPIKASDFSDPENPIGHYTQMAWADTIYVGCGISNTFSNGFMYYYVVCNYGPAGNHFGRTPYKSSEQGSGNLVCSGDCSNPYGNRC